MSGRSRPRGPRRFRVYYEVQVPASGYAWKKLAKAFSSPRRRDEEAAFLEQTRGVRNVQTVDASV